MAAPPFLLRLIGGIVPPMRRDDWIREWHGEIHYARNLEGQKPRTRLSSYLRLAGALEDAVWLRWKGIVGNPELRPATLGTMARWQAVLR